MNTLTIEDLKGIVAHISRIVDRSREHLIEIDGQIGDGDLGITMARGFAAARSETESVADADCGKLLMKVGAALAKAAPSTMGTLLASGFLAGGKAVAGSDALDLSSLAAFFNAFVDGVARRGKAKPGEKTVLDVLSPAAEALASAAAAGEELSEGMERCFDAAREGLVKTRDMIAQHGRPAYYQEQSRGKEDPGAAAGFLVIQGFRDWVVGPRP